MKYAFAIAAVLFGAMSGLSAYSYGKAYDVHSLATLCLTAVLGVFCAYAAIKTSHAGTQTKARVEAAQEVA